MGSSGVSPVTERVRTAASPHGGPGDGGLVSHQAGLLMYSQTAWVSAGSGEVLGWALSLRLPAWVVGVWLFHGMRPGRVPWRGVAQEGSVQLEVALPVLADRYMPSERCS
jgi:hypothetical protein